MRDPGRREHSGPGVHGQVKMVGARKCLAWSRDRKVAKQRSRGERERAKTGRRTCKQVRRATPIHIKCYKTSHRLPSPLPRDPDPIIPAWSFPLMLFLSKKITHTPKSAQIISVCPLNSHKVDNSCSHHRDKETECRRRPEGPLSPYHHLFLPTKDNRRQDLACS